jgi:hypothetical protein
LLNVIDRNPRAVLVALRRPSRDLRPIGDYTALWDADERKRAVIEEAGHEETSSGGDRCPLCNRPRSRGFKPRFSKK